MSNNLSLKNLIKLNKDSINLNNKLEEINQLFETCNATTENMVIISKRIADIFELYRDLINEINLD